MGVESFPGMTRFLQYMQGLEDSYTVIGGTACTADF